MAFENVGRDCDREIEHFAQELLKLEKSIAQTLYKAMRNMYKDYKDNKLTNQELQSKIKENATLKNMVEKLNIDFEKMFEGFDKAGFDPNDPIMNQSTETQTFGNEIDMENNVMNINDLDLSELGETFVANGTAPVEQFEQLSIFDSLDPLFGPEQTEMLQNMGGEEIGDIELPDFDLAL